MDIMSDSEEKIPTISPDKGATGEKTSPKEKTEERDLTNTEAEWFIKTSAWQ